MNHYVMKKINVPFVSLIADSYIQDIYTKKLAHLVSFMEEIKHYNHPQLNQWLEIEKLEMILDLPEIADREWSKESPAYQRIFLDFLNIHTSVYEKAIRLLNEKLLDH